MSSPLTRILGGVKWTGTSTIIITVTQLLQFAILARLLSKHDFGLMGMIMVVIVFAQVFTDFGISSAIIHRQDVNKNHLSSLYWLNLAAGITVFVIVLLLSPVISGFYKEPELEPLLFYVAFIFLITPFGQQFQFLLQKHLLFNVLAKIEVVAIVSGSISAVILAYLNFGVMSLIWGQIVTALLKALLFSMYGWKNWRPRLHFKTSDLKGYLSFGMFQVSSRTVNYFASNIDYLLIGRYLGTEALGIYTLAYQIIVIPVTKINPIVNKVAFPVFSLEQHSNATLTKGFLQITKMLSLISMPLLIGLIAVSDIFVPVIFGEKWVDAVPVIQVLSILGLLRVLMNPNGSVLLAKGRADLGFYWDLSIAAFNGLAIWMVVEKGVLYVATVYVLVSLINFILGRYLLKYVIGLQSRQYYFTILKPFMISTFMGGIVYVSYLLMDKVLDPSYYFLAGLVSLGGLIYAGLIYIFDRQLVTFMIEKLLKRKSKESHI